jgi:MFS family permease
MAEAPARPSSGRTWSPWRAVVGFGVISLSADMVYEGARSVYGPLLASVGASALVVGAVTGAGEAAALIFRVVFGPLADRTHRYWALTIAGYALTAICVPLLAVAPLLGGAGLAVATVLILAERLGKAIRSPAKSALLADAASQVGMGRGLGVHKALDQIGAFAGPLVVAGLVALTGSLGPGLVALAVPGAVAMVLLVITRRRLPEPEAPAAVAAPTAGKRVPLPPKFMQFAIGTTLCTAGLVTFGLISFALVRHHVVPTAGAPLLYAAAMAAGALAALATGEIYDRLGPRVLLGLPLLVAGVPALAFGTSLLLAVLGVLLWGVAVGVQDSTVKALVADLVPRERRATAYGFFAAVQGVGALLGGIAAGALYSHSVTALVIAVVASQVVALAFLIPVVGRRRVSA